MHHLLRKYVFMTIPIDRLYHYIENTAQDIFGARVLIYRFGRTAQKTFKI